MTNLFRNLLLLLLCVGIWGSTTGKTIILTASAGDLVDPVFGTYADSGFIETALRYKTSVERLNKQAADIKEYALKNNYNLEYCFLIDMSLPSGTSRFFVYDLKQDKIAAASLVSHGFRSANNQDKNEATEFSNTVNSYQTSLGKYKIGRSYTGSYGLSYKLHGLDITNDKAYERAIVLHSYKNIPESEADIEPFSVLFLSAGCPAVAPAFLTKLDTYIRASNKPILMWIYN